LETSGKTLGATPDVVPPPLFAGGVGMASVQRGADAQVLRMATGRQRHLKRAAGTHAAPGAKGAVGEEPSKSLELAVSAEAAALTEAALAAECAAIAECAVSAEVGECP
jgi:hypothetical protein